MIFTSAKQDYADWVLDKLDQDRLIAHRLYRQHVCHLDDGGCVKDLNQVGRDLSKCVLVDNKVSNFSNLPQNGIHIESYIDDPTDRELPKLGQRLLNMVNHSSGDIRVALNAVKY